RPGSWLIVLSADPTPQAPRHDSVVPYPSNRGGRGLLLQQGSHALAGLRALALPVFHAFQIDAQPFFLAAGGRVVKAHTLEKAAGVGIALVGHGDVVIRIL